MDAVIEIGGPDEEELRLAEIDRAAAEHRGKIEPLGPTEWTLNQYAGRLEIARSTAREQIDSLLEQERIVCVGKRKTPAGGVANGYKNIS